MKIEEYQALAMRTSPEGHDRKKNGCMGLIGEAGEIVDLVKKWLFQSGDGAALPTGKLIEECGDVLWYCAELATGLDASLARLYTDYSEDFYIDLHALNESAPIDLLACRLAAVAYRPWVELYDAAPDISEEWAQAHAKTWIVGIMVAVREILELFLGSTLEEAMERNIDKLRRRYPDGFDPERSLHRTE